ncbi:MAG: dephospho-CoA kinase [Akkermansiaceae bacterium]|nr:dephospho-CoA kinase [Akkermansiaceae bacterium]
MQVMVLTGGIACGKTTAGELLREFLPGLAFFDCDQSVGRLLDSDPCVADAIRSAFGDQAVAEDGGVHRHFLRQEVFGNGRKRAQLEEILHPRVMEECLASRDEAAKSGSDLFIADVPLFFEKGLDIAQQLVLVVATSRATQVQRLKARGGFDDSLIESMIAAQMPVPDKMSRADVVFWNEGPPETLRRQVQRFCQSFSHDPQ